MSATLYVHHKVLPFWIDVRSAKGWQAGSRRRMFEFAGLFILAEAVMYYLILNVWFTAWDFVKLDKIVTPLVGLLALGSGIYFITTNSSKQLSISASHSLKQDMK